ncbi:hypothetical protein FB192DRAFT_1450040 [Mucor lusitanicus]|uniref:BRCT domain-containing protein n=2 Tax=Mucor circinelloides f. lusitanicus TaxID=29924 RepID=A0A162RB99_MUCCL|nr:hypothetical protein FB192DRAFT_1450040 [Mucor lusitanicus]OAD03889.1 hypothetical protein MUCCIDRAFT_163423 [Mucor lusitanicus CBS 277.49]
MQSPTADEREQRQLDEFKRDSDELIKRRTSIPEAQVESISTQDIHVADLPPVLAKCTICIHHSTNRTCLALIAEGMGATVVSQLTSATTHLVIDPKNDAEAMEVVKQALANNVICSSPRWLMECYEKKMYFSAAYFPYIIKRGAHLWSEPALVSDSFAIDHIDFDAEESRRADRGQPNLDE